jgi:phage terminase large subunit-like protein
MGDTIDVFHLDEEPPMDILEQAGRGCIASGGRIRCTYTPENGQTEVVQKIKKEWSLHKAGWPDVAGEDFEVELDGEVVEFRTQHTLNGRKGHLTQKKVVDAMKNFAPYQMKMRMKGIPVLGSGLVFEYSEEIIKCSPLEGGIPNSWPRIAAIDFGGIAKKSHPSAVVYMAYDEDADVCYIYDCFRLH